MRILSTSALTVLALSAAAPFAWSATDSPDPAAIRAATGAITSHSSVDPNPPITGRVDPATYRVGPGDEFALRYSDLLDPRVLRIGPAGDLVLPDVGPLQVAGLTLAELQDRVRERMKPYVRGKGFTFSLYRPRRFRLQVAGEVERPGAVTLQAPVRASEAIAAAGGITADGARRGIQVRRGAETILVDLTLAARAGALASDPLVFESDLLFVPPSGPSVEILGSVPHPGRYEFVPGDRLSTLVALAGGPQADAALAEAVLEHFDTAGKGEQVDVSLEEALQRTGGIEDQPLRPGDRLFIPGRSRWMKGDEVVVVGEVARPGPYPIRSGSDRLRAVLARAGGFTMEADSTATRVERSEEAPRDSAFQSLAARSPDLLTPADRDLVVTSARERRALSTTC